MSTFRILCFLSLSMLLLGNCKDDNIQLGTLAEAYDASQHLYATEISLGNYENQELMIDLTTGQYKRFEDTKRSGPAFDLPLNSRELTNFTNGQRIFLDRQAFAILIQNLETGDIESIPLDEPGFPSFSFAPHYLTKGDTEEEVLLLDRSKARLVRVNLNTREVNVLASELYAYFNNPEAFIPLPDAAQFLFISYNVQTESNRLVWYDLATNTALVDTEFPEDFGFVRHPEQSDVYALTYPTEQEGFRLVRYQFRAGEIQREIVSTEDLPIDNLSPNMQTIHSGTQAYVCQGGDNDLDVSELANTLFSIDYRTGEFIRRTDLDGVGYFAAIKAE